VEALRRTTALCIRLFGHENRVMLQLGPRRNSSEQTFLSPIRCAHEIRIVIILGLENLLQRSEPPPINTLRPRGVG